MGLLGTLRPNLFPKELGSLNELGDPLPSTEADQGIPDLPSAPVLSPLQQRKSEVEADLERRSQPKSPATGILGKIGRTAAGIGNVLGDIFAPNATSLIPGSDLNNERIMSRDKEDLAGISKLESEDQSRKQSEATTKYQEARPEIEMGKIKQRLVTSLGPKGFSVTDSPDGGFDVAEDPETLGYQVQAAKMMHDQATAERQHILANIGEPGTPMYEDNQRRLAQIDKRIAISDRMAQLRGAQVGINKESLNLREDLAYNPEPTAQERTKGDLAQSAVHQIQVMRDIVGRRQDLFGPSAGSGTKFQTWLGSEDPDAAAYNAAQTYLAEHSAGVFGGRGAYIIQGLHSLSNQRQNPDALKSFLQEAEDTANTFVKAGTTHAKGEQGHAAKTATADQSLGATTKPDGVYEMDGKKYRVKGGQVYAH